jgi:hypothetical protein
MEKGDKTMSEQEVEGCGVFSIEIPQDLFILMDEKLQLYGCFCNRDYAELYKTWLVDRNIEVRTKLHIRQTRGNPPRETIEEYHVS